MKRRLAKLAAFLLLGAVANVAVAWGFAWGDSSQPARESWKSVGCAYEEWRSARYVRFDAATATGLARARCNWVGPQALVDVSFISPVDPPPLESIVSAWSESVLPRPNDSPTACYDRIIDLRGWPLLCLEAECETRIETRAARSQSTTDSRYRFAVRLPDRKNASGWDRGSPRMLPLRPLWPGFAINTAFYTAVCWLLLAAPFAIRRRRRIKRGLCPHCKYLIGVSPVCTECGAPVTPKRVEAAA